MFQRTSFDGYRTYADNVNHSDLTRDGIYFNKQPGKQWIKEAFQAMIEGMEAELRTMVHPVARGSISEKSEASDYRGKRGSTHSQL